MTVSYTVDAGVATIRFDRPEAMNGLDTATKEALLDAVNQAASDDAVRCVVLTGSGRAFCVGQDLKEHVGALKSGAPLSDTVSAHYNPTVQAILTMPKPVIAAVNGVAAGAGVSLALACDLRLMAASAGFNFAFAGIGLSCDTGASWLLPRLVGRAKALELLYFPSTMGAEAALAEGLVTRVVPDEQLAAATAELAVELASGPTLAYASIRQAVNNSAAQDIASSLAFEAEKMALTGASADHRAAVDAFLAKEKPTFEGR